MSATAAQRRAVHSVDVEHDPKLYDLLTKLAAAQPAEGTRVDDLTWCWVQAFADFDYEYAYLVDVRRASYYRAKTVTTSDYLAVFKGYDAQGTTWSECPGGATLRRFPRFRTCTMLWPGGPGGSRRRGEKRMGKRTFREAWRRARLCHDLERDGFTPQDAKDIADAVYPHDWAARSRTSSTWRPGQ